MTRVLTILFAVASFVASTSAAVPALAAGQRDQLLVTPQWLAAHLTDADLVLLHVGDKAEYDARHIPGARYVGARDLSTQPAAAGGLTLEMPAAEDLRARLETLGISDESRVVVYYGHDWVSPSTRVIVTLAHAGLTNVALLDGGMEAWTKAGRPVTDVVPPARTGRLTPREPRADIVDAEFVQAHLRRNGFAVIDARAAAFYEGAQEGGPRDRRVAGHIAGALSIPFSTMTTDDLWLKPQGALEAIFTAAGVRPGDTVITYCHIGQQATVVLVAARALGYNALLYDGSFEDWVRRGLPVENPAKK